MNTVDTIQSAFLAKAVPPVTWAGCQRVSRGTWSMRLHESPEGKYSSTDMTPTEPSADLQQRLPQLVSKMMQDGTWYVSRGRHVYSSVVSKEHLNDPDWIDAERAVGIGGSEVPGADLLIVLDLRSNPDDPRVLISDWRADGNVLVHHWRLVVPTLTSFLHRLGLTRGASQ